MQRCLTVLLTLLALGCSPSATTAGAKAVRVEKADPPEACQQVSVITASASNSGNDDETVRASLRERAAARGANYVRLDQLGGTETIKEYTGTAYKCPPGT